MTPAEELRAACSWDGCDRPVGPRTKTGLCKRHLSAAWRASDGPRCEEAGCDGRQYARRLCTRHYWRLRKHGSTAPPPKAWGPIEERFWRYLTPGDPAACWEWEGPRRRWGYGRLDDRVAHRLSYEIHNGPISEGLMVLHACDNPPCCNPSHLRLGTHAENMDEMRARGRADRKAENRSNLTEEEVMEIRARAAAGEPSNTLGREFGLTTRGCRSLIVGKTWKHLPVLHRGDAA